MRKSDLCKIGDKVKFEVHAPMKDGYNYQTGKVYDGCIAEHFPDSHTRISIIGDDKSRVMVSVYYDDFSSGMESFEIIISEEEFLIRKNEWLQKEIEKAQKEFDKRVEFLKNVQFD